MVVTVDDAVGLGVRVCTAIATKLTFTAAELAGVSQTFIDDRKDAATGNVVVTLKYPDLLPILRSCTVSETRRKMTVARGTQPGANLALVLKGIKLRKEIAGLLGHASWAAYVTETRMAGL